MQTTVPMLTYEDVGAAADWLCSAFGFRESGERYTDDEGRITHAELAFGDGEVMLGFASPHYRSPRRHAAECEHAARWLDNPYVVDGVLVHVDELDAHLERARAAGADILRGPDDQPFGRLYAAADVEGHRWMFVQP
ncbi:MAG TPA: VOC family protein [Gaiellaceae bacterium]|nr:VOC family protein [Gaiellaceae bacterium]